MYDRRTKDLVIIGAGGFAREVHQVVEDLVEDGSNLNFVGFLDSDESNHGSIVHEYEVLGGPDWLEGRDNISYIVGVGSPAVRRNIVEQVERVSRSVPATLLHPEAWIGNRVEIGAGTVVCANNSITTDIVIGDHVALNLGCTVGHDTVIRDFVTASPTATISGNVRLEPGVELGTGSTVLQNLIIGQWSVVGGGAVVVKDVPQNSVAVGVPAKVVKAKEPGWHLDSSTMQPV